MSPERKRIMIAEACGIKFGGPYVPHKWTTELESELNPGEFLTASGFICTRCGQYHIGQHLEDAYCCCGINPEWVIKGIQYWKWENWKSEQRVPDYLNDLNAMHEAEKSLPQGVLGAYCFNLGRVLGLSDEISGWLDGFYLAHATAAQRAEAFRKTLGLEDE